MNYKDKYLHESDNGAGRTNTFKKTVYGYKIERRTPFVAIYKTTLFIYSDGFAKSMTKAKVNYRPDEQWTYYYDADGENIQDENNSTRKELAIWKRLRKAAAK